LKCLSSATRSARMSGEVRNGSGTDMPATALVARAARPPESSGPWRHSRDKLLDAVV
jgi:hypothetical protein